VKDLVPLEKGARAFQPAIENADKNVRAPLSNQLNSRAGFEPRGYLNIAKGMLAPFGNPLCPPQEAGLDEI